MGRVSSAHYAVWSAHWARTQGPCSRGLGGLGEGRVLTWPAPAPSGEELEKQSGELGKASHLWKLQPREKGRFVQNSGRHGTHTYHPVKGSVSCFSSILHFFTVFHFLEASGAAIGCQGSLITRGPDHCILSQPLSLVSSSQAITAPLSHLCLSE